MADGILYHVCSHGTLFVTLLDKAGDPIGTAPIPVEEIDHWLADIRRVADEWLKGQPGAIN